MSTNLDESTSITMPKGTLLVLFEYLARSYGSWKESSGASDEASFSLERPMPENAKRYGDSRVKSNAHCPRFFPGPLATDSRVEATSDLELIQL